jgi:glutathione S-transferase
MITVFGEGRGFRVVWLLEEMGLAYRLRPVDLLVGVEHDPEYLAINPAGFIPAIQDGDVTMVESIAIMLAASMYFVVVSRNLAPAAERQNWGAGKALEVFESRLGLVTRQLARSSYLAGDRFTAADISVTYALEFAQRTGCFALGEAERAYVIRTSEREGYKRAMETCQATKAWAARVARR